MEADDRTGTLAERATHLKQASPAAYLAVVRQADAYEAQGAARDAALERALRAVSR